MTCLIQVGRILTEVIIKCMHVKLSKQMGFLSIYKIFTTSTDLESPSVMLSPFKCTSVRWEK